MAVHNSTRLSGALVILGPLCLMPFEMIGRPHVLVLYGTRLFFTIAITNKDAQFFSLGNLDFWLLHVVCDSRMIHASLGYFR